MNLLPVMNFLPKFRAVRPRTGVDDQAFARKVLARNEDWHGKSDQQLTEATDELRRAVREGANPVSPQILTAAFGIVVESFRRAHGILLYEVQLIAGRALAQLNVAEMQTGEGKTFVAALPAFVHCLAGDGVHVMTVNDYLAARDYELLLPAFRLMGVTTGLLKIGDSLRAKQEAYASDVTYGPGYEFGFDYLRDQVARMSRGQPALGTGYRARLRGGMEKPVPMRQRGHAVAVIDEVDSVLLDEATTPLILTCSQPRKCEDATLYLTADRIVEQFIPDSDFLFQPEIRLLQLTDHGRRKSFELCQSVPRPGLRRPWPSYVEQALKAKHVFHRDRDYVVSDDRIQLVDQNTGRIFEDRSWSDGLQQAVQAKERITITSENEPLARITRQRYFGLYERACGMTGTASDSRREFREAYKLNIAIIPPRKSNRRKTCPNRFFVDQDAKHAAIVEEVIRIHRSGQPVLVGTTSIEQSQIVAERLAQAKVVFQLLNGLQTVEEATVIARGGQRGAVTIATNMAGRGTDIKLGPGVAELGGLHVICTELQESSRVDRQLVGRSARQGDPGSSQRFMAANDRIIAQYAPELSARMRRLAGPSGEISVDLTADVDKLLRKIECQRHLQRRKMFAADDWLDKVKHQLSRAN